MTSTILDARDISFLLYELLDTESVLMRPRYQEHSREVCQATLETAQTIANKYFANHYAKGDANEPTFDGETVTLIPETQAAWNAVADAGFMAAHQDFDEGGMQLPSVVCAAASAYFNAANIATSGYHFLTIGACNLIRSFASDEHKGIFMPPMMDGRFSGTMALTEPGQGSALADISTVAEPAADGSYRISGQKMFISKASAVELLHRRSLWWTALAPAIVLQVPWSQRCKRACLYSKRLRWVLPPQPSVLPVSVRPVLYRCCQSCNKNPDGCH